MKKNPNSAPIVVMLACRECFFKKKKILDRSSTKQGQLSMTDLKILNNSELVSGPRTGVNMVKISDAEINSA